MSAHNQTPELIGIDVGGTFTDFVWLVDGVLHVHKEATTPEDQSRAVVAGLAELGVSEGATVVHGTTVATNALLERRGARTALLTTEGFADVLVIGRQNRPHLYRLSQERPPPLVPDALRFEVPERLDAQGHVLQPLDEAAVRRIAGRLEEEAVESLAVVFLFAYQNAEHERRAAQLIQEHLPDLPISTSSAVLPEYREYERTSTTTINAYVRPVVARYLNRLEETLGRRPVRVMQSNGGAIGLAQASEEAARLVLSGPAGGVVGAMAVARQAMEPDVPRLLTFDMGGTSSDVALCPGEIPRTSEGAFMDLPLRLPTTEIHTVGAGGGSIARVDAGGVLRVGPESAGAAPGPVCYGRGGTQPTVTDANLVLGRLDPHHFLGGSATLGLEAAREALARLGDELHLSSEEAALGVIRVANATMERALRRVSVERGHDPRDYTLVPFGGAGPMHACELAQSLGVRRVLVPPAPGVLSALGLLMADVVYDSSRTVLRSAAALQEDLSELRSAAEALTNQVREVLRREDVEAPDLQVLLDLRYVGQSYELEIPLDSPVTAERLEAAVQAFHRLHEQRYGHRMAAEPVEVVTLRVRGRAPGVHPDLPQDPPADTDVRVAMVGERRVYFDKPVQAVCYDRDRLRHGHRFNGPAIAYQYDTTLVIPPGWDARVDAWRNVWVERADQ